MKYAGISLVTLPFINKIPRIEPELPPEPVFNDSEEFSCISKMPSYKEFQERRNKPLTSVQFTKVLQDDLRQVAERWK